VRGSGLRKQELVCITARFLAVLVYSRLFFDTAHRFYYEKSIVTFIEQYPEIVALLILLVGYFVSGWTANLVITLITRLERSINRLFNSEIGITLSETGNTLLRRFVFYFCLLLALLLSLRVLGLSTMTTFLDRMLLYVPQLVMGFLILLLGYLLSVTARNFVARIVPPAQARSLPLLVQSMVLMIAVLTGLEQMQLDISFLTNLLILFIGLMLLGLALAFAIGARQLISNLLASRELSRYALGDRLSIDGVEGTICEIHQTGVVIQSKSGFVNLPAALFAQHQVTLLKSQDD
jgi:hypothetical protein